MLHGRSSYSIRNCVQLKIQISAHLHSPRKDRNQAIRGLVSKDSATCFPACKALPQSFEAVGYFSSHRCVVPQHCPENFGGPAQSNSRANLQDEGSSSTHRNLCTEPIQPKETYRQSQSSPENHILFQEAKDCDRVHAAGLAMLSIREYIFRCPIVIGWMLRGTSQVLESSGRRWSTCRSMRLVMCSALQFDLKTS